MFEPSRTSFVFSRRPRTFGPELLVATLKVSISTSVSAHSNQDEIRLLMDELNWQVYYCDCVNPLARAKTFSINTCSSFEGRQYVEAAFAYVAGVDLPKIASEVTSEEISTGVRTVTAVSGYVAWLPIYQEFVQETLIALKTASFGQFGNTIGEFLNRAIAAQRDAMNFSAAGYKAVEERFQPVFDSTRIRVPFERLNY